MTAANPILAKLSLAHPQVAQAVLGTRKGSPEESLEVQPIRDPKKAVWWVGFFCREGEENRFSTVLKEKKTNSEKKGERFEEFGSGRKAVILYFPPCKPRATACRLFVFAKLEGC